MSSQGYMHDDAMVGLTGESEDNKVEECTSKAKELPQHNCICGYCKQADDQPTYIKYANHKVIRKGKPMCLGCFNKNNWPRLTLKQFMKRSADEYTQTMNGLDEGSVLLTKRAANYKRSWNEVHDALTKLAKKDEETTKATGLEALRKVQERTAAEKASKTGIIQPRAKGGAYPKRNMFAQPPDHPPPAHLLEGAKEESEDEEQEWALFTHWPGRGLGQPSSSSRGTGRGRSKGKSKGKQNLKGDAWKRTSRGVKRRAGATPEGKRYWSAMRRPPTKFRYDMIRVAAKKRLEAYIRPAADFEDNDPPDDEVSVEPEDVGYREEELNFSEDEKSVAPPFEEADRLDSGDEAQIGMTLAIGAGSSNPYRGNEQDGHQSLGVIEPDEEAEIPRDGSWLMGPYKGIATHKKRCRREYL